jgi:hypothetical protein
MPTGTKTLTDIPSADLAQVVQGFIDEGGKVTATPQADGNYTVVAVFDGTPVSGPSGSSSSSKSSSSSSSGSSLTSPPHGTVLGRPGIPWIVQVDGDDLVVRNVLATCFGGEFDSGDNGETESGVMNHGFPTADAHPMGVALPIRSLEAATRGSPLAFGGAHIPWLTTVKVWLESAGESTAIECILIDNGPDVLVYPTHALDLNPNVALHYSPGFDPKRVADHWSGSGFSYRIVGGAKYVSPYQS